MATMQDDTCLLCHNEVHFNPTMKLMMAVCGHKFCESCVTLTFLKATSLICPASDCHTSLRKNSLVLQSADDSVLQKENSIRKRILKIYNKRREDFPTLLEYNNYLETVEDIVFNLVNNIDVEATNEKMKKYSAENQQSIYINQSKQASEAVALSLRIVEDEKNFQERKRNNILHDQQEEQLKLRIRLNIVDPKTQKAGKANKDKLIPPPAPATVPSAPTSSNPANQHLQYRPSQPQPQPPTAQPANNTTLFAQPMVKKGTTTTATTTTTPASATPPTLTEAEQRKRERAGGYHEEYIRLRAIQEAFAALWIPSNDIIENNNNRLLDNKYDDNAMRIS